MHWSDKHEISTIMSKLFLVMFLKYLILLFGEKNGHLFQTNDKSNARNVKMHRRSISQTNVISFRRKMIESMWRNAIFYLSERIKACDKAMCRGNIISNCWGCCQTVFIIPLGKFFDQMHFVVSEIIKHLSRMKIFHGLEFDEKKKQKNRKKIRQRNYSILYEILTF